MKKAFIMLCFVSNFLLMACEKATIVYEDPLKELFESDFPTTEIEIQPPQISWIDAYCRILESGQMAGSYFLLIDIDFDEIPEMFWTRTGSGGTWIDYGFSFKDGKILDIPIGDELLYPELNLYKHRESNEMIWLAEGVFQNSHSYRNSWQMVDFSDLNNLKKEFFFAWKVTSDREQPKEGVVYSLLDEDYNEIIMSKEEIDEREMRFFSEYEQIQTLTLFSSVGKFYTERGFDKDLFLTFASLYDSTVEQNKKIVPDSFHPLPIESIVNADLYEDSDYLLSLVSKRYHRLDIEADADITINYTQLSNFHNQKLLNDINEMLLDNALSDWRIESEEGLKLNIIQSSNIYQNYLSITKWTDCHIYNAQHPWCSFSSMVIDINTGNILNLEELMIIDETIKDKIYSGYFINNRFSHEECLEMHVYAQLCSSILEHPYASNNFFLRDEGVSFIIDVPHVMGDYLIFYISIEDLGELWKGIR